MITYVIRLTKIGNAASGETYYTFRLGASEHIGGKVRQQTLFNLGRNFTLPREHWPELCRHIEQILTRQMSHMSATAKIETLHVRKVTVPEPAPNKIYATLRLSLTPGEVKK